MEPIIAIMIGATVIQILIVMTPAVAIIAVVILAVDRWDLLVLLGRKVLWALKDHRVIRAQSVLEVALGQKALPVLLGRKAPKGNLVPKVM